MSLSVPCNPFLPSSSEIDLEATSLLSLKSALAICFAKSLSCLDLEAPRLKVQYGMESNNKS